MDALVMCGGQGSRLDADAEKPLVEVGGVPMVDRVIGALRDSSIDELFGVTSPDAPETADHVDVPTIETPGEDYVADLRAALDDERVGEPVLTVVADLPLLDGAVVDAVLDRWNEGGSLTVAVPVDRKEALGTSVDPSFVYDGRDVAPSGLNVVGGEPDRVLVRDDDRLAVNVNRPADLAVARRFA